MSKESFRFKICTPQGVFLEDTVSEVTLPGEDGLIGVLPGHTGYTGLIGTGVVEYVSHETNSPQRLVISGGFTSFGDDSLLLLADSADSADTIDRDSYGADRAKHNAGLEAHTLDSAEWGRAKSGLLRIEAIDELISH